MTRLETLAYSIRSHVIDLCEAKSAADNIDGWIELGPDWGRDVAPCVRSGRACLACVAEAEKRAGE